MGAKFYVEQVEPKRTTLMCECFGTMRCVRRESYTGQPTKYLHECSTCHNQLWLSESYPRIEYVPIFAADSYFCPVEKADTTIFKHDTKGDDDE